MFFLPFSSRDQGLNRVFFAPIPTLIKGIGDFFKDQNPRTNALLAENSDTIVPAVNTTTSTEKSDVELKTVVDADIIKKST
jgi:hypothetical protein